MKWWIVCLSLLVISTEATAQKSRKFNGKSRRDFFGGAEDYRDITKNGLQISFGPNYTFTRLNNETVSGFDNANRPINSTVDPAGRLGGFIDVGMAHYRLKSSRVLDRIYKLRGEKGPVKWIGGNLIHRVDWGLGFNYIGGKETTTTDFLNPSGTIASTQSGEGKFYNGYLTARITADRFTILNEKWHLETGLGFNFNYAVLAGSQSYSSPVYLEQKFQKNFMAQLHGHIAFDYKIRRGDYLSFGFFIPAIGIYEANRLKPTVQWYSSNYWPVQLQLKWIHHFTKKSNGCNTGSPEDKKRNQEYMQNR